MGDDAELENFKRSINLEDYAKAHGYRETAKRGPVTELHNDDGDKIDVWQDSKNGGNHWVFKSWKDNASGTILQFVQYIHPYMSQKSQFGRVRQHLRHWTPAYHAPRPSPARQAAPPREPLNRPALIDAWRHFRPYGGGYLEARGINAATLATAADRLRLDERGNVAFRHDDLTGISGWELKNRTFTGFAGGGRKALFALRVGYGRDESPPRLVVTESALDALSFHQLDPAPALLLSFGGGLSEQQRELLAHVLTKYPAAAVLAATDNDKQGEEYAALIRQHRPDAIRAHSPTGKDWNDTIRPENPARRDRPRPFDLTTSKTL